LIGPLGRRHRYLYRTDALKETSAGNLTRRSGRVGGQGKEEYFAPLILLGNWSNLTKIYRREGESVIRTSLKEVGKKGGEGALRSSLLPSPLSESD